MKYRVVVEGRSFEVEIGHDGRVWVDRRLCDVDLEEAIGQPWHSLLLDNRSFETQVRPSSDGGLHVTVAGRRYRTSLERTPGDVGRHRVPEEQETTGDRGADASVACPLPGLLVEVRVAEGDWVDEGDVVAVLESMKMHLELCAPRAGVVRELGAGPGREVDTGEVLAVIASP